MWNRYCHPDQYFFDGEWRAMQQRTEVIKVKGERDRQLVVRETHFGPVVTEFAFAQRGEPEVALKRIPVWESKRETIEGAVAMLRARDVEEFDRALEGWRFPSINMLFADSGGRIGYRTAVAAPLRSPAAPNGGGVAHVGLHEGGVGGERPAVPGRQVVEHHDAAARPQQRANHV